jgi:hypothetical protein
VRLGVGPGVAGPARVTWTATARNTDGVVAGAFEVPLGEPVDVEGHLTYRSQKD